jgi:hypothetical protein
MAIPISFEQLHDEMDSNNKKTNSAGFLINNQMGGGINLLNINRVDVFAADHSNFPSFFSHGCNARAKYAARARQNRHVRGKMASTFEGYYD